MNLAFKIYAAIILALVVGSLFFVAKERNETLLSTQARVVHDIYELERLDVEIEAEAWKTGFMLYNDYDQANALFFRARALLDRLMPVGLIQEEEYAQVRELLQLYRKKLVEKDEHFQAFITINSLIKNSTTHVPSMSIRYIQQFGEDGQDQDYLYELAQVTASVFLARNALDADFVEQLDETLVRMRSWEFDNPEKERFHEVFLAHARVVQEYLPRYLPAFQRVLESDTLEILHRANEGFVLAGDRQAERISRISLITTSAFVLSILTIIYFLLAVERKHVELQGLHTRLEQAATTDRLTGLSNRTQFELDQEGLHEGEAAVLVVNIDGFKNVNDFFGHAAGDEVLKHMSKVLADAMGGRSLINLYRIGADDFAVLLDDLDHIDLEQIAQLIIDRVDSAEFMLEEHRVPMSVSLGMSRYAPLLETADMALRTCRESRRRYLAYDPALGMKTRVANNLLALRHLRQALRSDGVEPFFMPLLNLHNGEVERYECLIRVRKSDGELMMPMEFLDVAKESRLYGEFTRIMIAKSLDRFADTDYGFAINLSIEDILDESVSSFLFQLLEVNPGIGKRLTLEILESEEVENYEAVRDFVAQARAWGCRIAIDDFGSGYSNLKHLLNLQVDNLKIDASLIRDISSDSHSRATVTAIVRLARDVGIKSVTAEFVHNQEVLDVVKELGLDYAQGYHIGPPSPALLENPV